MLPGPMPLPPKTQLQRRLNALKTTSKYFQRKRRQPQTQSRFNQISKEQYDPAKVLDEYDQIHLLILSDYSLREIFDEFLRIGMHHNISLADLFFVMSE